MKVKQETRVKEIMSTDLITVNHDDNLLKVEEKFQKYNIHHLPVLKNNELVGMLSQGDLLMLKDWGTFLNLRRSSLNNEKVFKTHTAEDIMSNQVFSVNENLTIKELAKIMKPNKIHAFPVMRGSELMGIISTYDIIQKTFA